MPQKAVTLVITILLLPIALLLRVAPVAGQEEPVQAGADALRVFIDCAGGFRSGCDREYLRQEIGFVNWVRQPQDAQVHIIVTTQSAGAGGTRYTFDFMGREGLDGLTDELTFSAGATDVEQEVVEGVARTLRLGLVRYAALAGFGDALDVGMSGAERTRRSTAGPASVQDDPWNFWVFDISADGRLDREDRRRSHQFGFGVSANRTTEEWKLNLRASGDWEREEYELSSGTEHNDQDSWSTSAFAVKTLGDHWGVGAELEANNSTQLNRELLVSGGAGVEYNIFPYSESTRRVLLARYVVSVADVQYRDTTIFDVMEETNYQHGIALDYDAREAWGNASFNASANQFLDRSDFYSLRVGGFLRYRLFRGFSVNLNGSYRVIRDQIFLPKEELSDEDILLGRRRLPTDSELQVRMGVSYSFGSIFNNAVNSRFRRGVL